MTKKPILHLLTQDNQPIHSTRKCCEICGKSMFDMDGVTSGWTDDRSKYKKDFAENNNLTLCKDLP